MNLISEQKGYTIHLDNRMWFPTMSDIRNCCASTGLEVNRLEDLVEKYFIYIGITIRVVLSSKDYEATGLQWK